MPIKIDYSDARDAELMFRPDLDFDEPFTFYYDETNNIHKLRLREKGFNVDIHGDFVLGGICYQGDKPDLSHIFDGLGIQKTVHEVKLTYIAKGTFEECLSSKNLDTFLNRILTSPVYLHYTSLNLLYWSIVDIIDSSLASSLDLLKKGPLYVRFLKDTLYRVCNAEIDAIATMFYHHKYPNLKETDIAPFITDLLHILKPYESHPEYKMGLHEIKKLLLKAQAEGTLPFLEDEEDHLLINSLRMIYLRSIYVFKHSEHIFDEEGGIMRDLLDAEIVVDGVILSNYRFADSKNEILIQISDVLMGLVGKLNTFVNSFTAEEIVDKITKFDAIQLSTLDTYLDVLTKTDSKNQTLLHTVASDDYGRKMTIILKMRNKI
jgi:hypothetical protein